MAASRGCLSPDVKGVIDPKGRVASVEWGGADGGEVPVFLSRRTLRYSLPTFAANLTRCHFMTYTTLITPAELADHLGDPGWIVFDCRFTLTSPGAGLAAYKKSHIPGARYAHLDDDLSAPVGPDTGRHPLPDTALLARKLGAWGVGDDTQVVVYDDNFGAIAARLWWLLRWLGHDAVALLDGGFPRWQREGHPVDDAEVEPAPARFEPRPNDALWVDAHFVERAVEHGGALLIDARSEERFTGEREPLDTVAGHVPGAVNLPYEDNLALSGDFLSADELREEYLDLLNERDSEHVVHMCGSGVTACHNLLAMEAAGLPSSKLYVGSWSEWITDPKHPVATGTAGADHPHDPTKPIPPEF